jgi:hypothetical protein
VLKPKDKSAITPGNAKWVKGQSSGKVVDNLMLKAKKDMAQEKKSRALTCGGFMEEASVAGELSQMVASYCNEELHPLENDEDDYAGYHETKRKCILFTHPPCSSTQGSRCSTIYPSTVQQYSGFEMLDANE